MKNLYLPIFCSVLLLTFSSSAIAYKTLEADYAACMSNPGKNISNADIVKGCTRLIDNSAKENSLVGTFYALRAIANFDKKSNCRDAHKAGQLIKDPNLLKTVAQLKKMNC